MILAKLFCPVRTRCRTLCLLTVFVIITHLIWNNMSFHYLSKRILAKSESEVIKSGNHVFDTPQSSQPRPIKKMKLVRHFRIGKIVDNGSNVNDHPKVLRDLQKPAIEKSNVNKLEQQKDKCENNTAKCKLYKTYDKILEYFRIRENETKDSFVNLHRYGYHLDSSACRQKPDVAILVHSKFDHFGKRKQIRSTWGSNRTFNGKTFTTVFFLGEPSIPHKNGANPDTAWLEEQARQVDAVRKKIHTEASAFGDIVMGNFTDAYRNLTIKHIMALNWVTTHCPQVEYIAKVDDDVLVNVFSIVQYISGTNRSTSGLLACRLPEVLTPFRRNKTKWSVSETEYPFHVFPLWCMGFGELMTRDVAQSLLKTSADVRRFWVDDVYVTGLLRHKAGLQVKDMYDLYDYNQNSFFVLTKHMQNESFWSYWTHIVAKYRHHLL